MPDTILDNPIFQQMAEIATCLCAKIEENGLPKVCFCGIIAGDGPYDMTGFGSDCDDDGCGQAWVRLSSAYPSTQVGVADVVPNNCGKGLGYDIEVGIIRCVTIPEDGEPMDGDEMLAASQLQIADMLTMQQALLCCTAFGTEDFVVGSYQPSGPDGGLLGGMWPVSITVI